MDSTEPRFVLDDADLAPYDRLGTLVWIADIDDWHVCWANGAALRFWDIARRQDLATRRFSVSPTVRELHHHVREQLREAPHVVMDRTVYPDGRAPVRLSFRMSLHPLPNGRDGLFCEAHEIKDSDPELLRRLDAVRYAPLAMSTHSLEGITLSANSQARLTFGARFDFIGLFVHEATGRRCVERLSAGEDVSEDVELLTLEGPRWFALEARSVTDPVDGARAILLSAHEVTARREAERYKDELISVVSHELRTPITSIRGALGLLAGGVASGDENMTKELLTIANDSSIRLARLVDDLLDAQRLATGALDLSPSRVDLGALVLSTVDLFRPSATLSGLAIFADCPPGITCSVDARRIEQVVSNLLSNAIKHSFRGSSVRVLVRSHAGRARVSVVDQGRGVPASFRGRIFGAFQQADASDDRRLGGAGLGLHISKTLVELHGGTLGYDESVPRGASFFFDLPLAPPSSDDG